MHQTFDLGQSILPRIMKRWLHHNWTLVAWYSWIATLVATLGYFFFGWD